jgi:hypothetical protein
MPPPPPPSKSYLLVLDTDSEDEDEYERQQQQRRRPPPPSPTSHYDYNKNGNNIHNLVEDDDADDVEGVDTSVDVDNNDSIIPRVAPVSSTAPITAITGRGGIGMNARNEKVLKKDLPTSPPSVLLVSSSTSSLKKEEEEEQQQQQEKEQQPLQKISKNQKKNKKKKRKKKKSKQDSAQQHQEEEENDGNNDDNDDDDENDNNNDGDDADNVDEDRDDDQEQLGKERRQQRQLKQKQYQQRPRHRVTFANVLIRTYPRAFSEDAVPADGGWPLGMSLDGYQDHDQLPLEDYEMCKQQDLLARWDRIRSENDEVVAALSAPPLESPTNSSASSLREQQQHKLINAEVIRLMDHSSLKGSNRTNHEFPYYLETRQWDYRNGVRNPLFGLLVEEKRQSLFLESSTPIVTDGEENTVGGGGGGKGPTNCFDPQQLQQNMRRNRSNSVASGGSQSSSNTTSHPNRRARSNSFGSHNTNVTSSNSNGSHEQKNGNSNNNNKHHDQFNETYNQVYVHHVRNELEQLRIERSKTGATGCNCRKLTVYIPPKDGSGGKKAQHRRLKPSKLTQELKKRNLYDASSSREEMEKTLHDAVEREPCCSTDDCFCVRNGIDCQADACSCWHDSHVHTKSRTGDTFPSTEEIKARCGNPLGMYVVDLEAIDSYRRQLLQSVPLIPWQLPERTGHNDHNQMMLLCQQCDPIMV